jgi:hypothetical protein
MTVAASPRLRIPICPRAGLSVTGFYAFKTLIRKLL